MAFLLIERTLLTKQITLQIIRYRFYGLVHLRAQVFLFPNPTQPQHPVLLRRGELLPILPFFAFAKAAFAQALRIGFAHAFAGIGQVKKFELFHSMRLYIWMCCEIVSIFMVKWLTICAFTLRKPIH